MMNAMYDTRMKSYQIAVESFNQMAMDQEKPAYRSNYRTIAMEAVAGPDTGMVLDRLYKSIMGRASINFGKIPESMGDLTKFFKYKSLAESLTLLHRNLDEYNIYELKLTQELHDTIIRCREDFAYGFKADSQFLKTTYNTMVYSLCEMINLVTVIYIDMLKAQSEGRPYDNKGYGDLMLVQNVQKFVDMVKSGEWATMMTGIRKDARNLLDVVFGGDQGDTVSNAAINALKAPTGIFGVWAAVSHRTLINEAKQNAYKAAGGAGTYSKDAVGKLGKAASKQFNDAFNTARSNIGFKEVGKQMINIINPKGKPLPAKILIIIVAIVAALMIIRSMVILFWSGAYKLRDILDDNERFLKAHMDRNSDPSGTSKSVERQKGMYQALSGLRDSMEEHILKSDAAGRKEMKKANADEFKPEAFQSTSATDGDNSDFAIG